MNQLRPLGRLSLAVALASLLATTPIAAQNRRTSGQSGSKAGSAAPRAQAPSGRTATPRAAAPRQSSGDRGGSEARRGSSESSTRAGGSSGNRREGRVVPPDTQARERGDRPADGVAVPRGSSGGGRPHVPRYYRYPYYAYGYPYGYPYGYGYGYGYSFADPYLYDPFFWGFPGIGVGYPYGYSTYAYGGSSSYGGGSYDAGQYGGAHASIGDGGLRLKVKPREAEVLVDGSYVGRVDDFDGMFQRLELASGTHRIEIRAEGYQPLGFDVRIPIDDTITYRGELEKTTR